MGLKINYKLLVFLITLCSAILSCGLEANYPEVPSYEVNDPNEEEEQEEEEEEEEEEPIRNFKLIALGDSYTIGQNVCEDCRFPVQLKDSLQTYFNVNDTFSLEIIAQTGWTTTNLKNAIASVEPASDFDLATLLIGVNNQYQNKPFDLYETEFVELVTTAISLTGGDASKLIIVSIPDYAYTLFGQGQNPTVISSQLEEYNAFAQSYCEDNNLNYVYITDITQEGLENPALVASDNLHPSTLAYTKFVKRMLPTALEILD